MVTAYVGSDYWENPYVIADGTITIWWESLGGEEGWEEEWEINKYSGSYKGLKDRIQKELYELHGKIITDLAIKWVEIKNKKDLK